MSNKNIPALVIVGGFLGAGKTTLILKAADMLRTRGKRVAVILNDQDAGLVDTQHALARDVMAREVADGCFCCRFSEFIEMAEQLAAHQPDVIFAEPVGSCIDLTATVIRPLQSLYSDRLRLAPFSVLLDPATIERLSGDALDPDVRYLITHQLAEADLICTTRQDLYPSPADFSLPVDFQLSGKTGLGVEEWLDEVLKPSRIVGARLLFLDYGRYADAEAALGWLNLHAQVDLAAPLSPALLCGPLLDAIESALTRAGIVIAHLKIFDRAGSAWIKASICANRSEPDAEGDLLADAAEHHELALNLRAVADPDRCKNLVLSALNRIDGTVRIQHLRAFRPPPPKPEHRSPVLV
ncbi:MAG: GTP-binding protein [Bryobacteraceae bacterium]